MGAAFERYLALADDEEGVSSGPLPDDVFLVLVVSLHGRRFTAQAAFRQSLAETKSEDVFDGHTSSMTSASLLRVSSGRPWKVGTLQGDDISQRQLETLVSASICAR